MQSEKYDKLSDLISLYKEKAKFVEYFDYYYTQSWQIKRNNKNIKFYLNLDNLAAFLFTKCKEYRLNCDIIPNVSVRVIWKTMMPHLITHNDTKRRQEYEITKEAYSLLYSVNLPMRALLLSKIAGFLHLPVESIPNFEELMDDSKSYSPLTIHQLEALIKSLTIFDRVAYTHRADSVVYIDSDQSFIDAIRSISESSKHSILIAIDCEYSPGSSRIELLQLATAKTIYLVDCTNIGDDVWGEFVRCVAVNGSLHKIGFDLEIEEKMLSQHIGRNLSLIPKTDLKTSQKMINRLKQSTDMDKHKIGGEYYGGLSSLTHQVLNRGLNKAQRMSDWTARPLSEEQLAYAANDAYVCIDIYQRIQLLSVIYNSIDASVLENLQDCIELTESTCHSGDKPYKIDKSIPIIVPPKFELLGRRLRSLGYSNVYFGIHHEPFQQNELKKKNKSPIAFFLDSPSVEEQWVKLCSFIGCNDDYSKPTHCPYCGEERSIPNNGQVLSNDGTESVLPTLPLNDEGGHILAEKNQMKANNSDKSCVTCGYMMINH